MSIGRFQILEYPIALPGKCATCGSVGGDGRKFVDLGVVDDFYGSVYLCTLCMIDAMNTMGGWVLSEVYESLKERFVVTENLLKESSDECKRLCTALDAIRSLGIVSPSNVVADQSDTRDSVKAGSEAKRTANGNDKGVSESRNGGRRPDVPDPKPSDSPIEL